MSRKWFQALLSTALISVLVLAACSGNSANPANTPTATESAGNGSAATGNSANASNEKLEPLEISFVFADEGNHMEEGALMLQEIEKRTNTKIDVTLFPANDFASRINLLLASGKVPDVLFDRPTRGFLFSNQITEAIKGGLFHDLTPYIEDPDFVKKYPNLNYSKETWDLLRFNGKIYGLPRQINQIGHGGIWVRADLLEKAGLKAPTTMDELAEVMIALSDPPNRYGMEMRKAFESTIAFTTLTTAFTGTLEWEVSDQGDFTFHAFTPKYTEFLLWLKNLYDHKAIDPEFALNQKNDLFGDGKSAFYLNAIFARPTYPNYKFFADNVPKDARTMLLDPIKGPNGWTVGTTTGFGEPALLSSSFPKKDIPRFFELWNYLASDDKLELEEFGIEGVHHKVVNGVKERTPKYNEDRVNEYESLGWNKVVDKIKLHADAGAGAEIVDQMYKVSKRNIELVKEMKLQFPTYGLDTPLYASNFPNVIKQFEDNRVKLIMGAMTVEEWNQYVKTVTSSADYQKIIAELKNAYLNKK